MNSGPKWSLRNGSQYQRLCARAGCGAAAVATLRFQSTQRRAWLVELDVNASRTQGDLCQRHAAALVLPRGWDLHDEREPGNWAPVVGSDVGTEPAPKNGNGGRRVRTRRNGAAAEPTAEVAQLPGLEPAVNGAPQPPEAVEETVPLDPADPADADDSADSGTPARAVPAQFGVGDEEDVEEVLGEILDARTPLLQRAFRNAKPL